MNMGRLTLAARTVELVRADVDEGAQVAMVSTVDDKDILSSRVGPSQAESQVVRLAAARDKIKNAQRGGQFPGQAKGIFDDVIMEIAGVCVEDSYLLAGSADNTRMAMTHVSDVIDRVEVGLAVLVVEVLSEATNNLEGMPVGNAQIRTEVFPTKPENLLLGPHRKGWGRKFFDHTENKRGVGTEVKPYLFLTRRSRPRKIPPPSEKVNDDLEVDMGRPATVLLRTTNPAHWLAFGDDLSFSQLG